MIGCGSEETMLHPAHAGTDSPRGRSTALIASPSGTLCTAIAITMTSANVIPPPNETPTATPSANECTVITISMSSMRRGPSPLTRPNCRLRRPSHRWVARMNATPVSAPATVCQLPYCVPSATSPKLAPSIRPAATALARATAAGATERTKPKGRAPSPVANAVMSP